MTRVLLIDDDRALLALMESAFAKHGYMPFTAGDGAEGLELFHAIQPDLVITDIIMPEREGISVVIEVKSGPVDTRLIAISGGGEGGRSSYLRWAKELGADRVLQKPFRISELLHAAKELVSGSGDLEFSPSIALNA